MKNKCKCGYKKYFSVFTFIVIFISLIFLCFPAKKINAQSTNQVIYDYVILIDTSGSMNDGTPPLFSQVQKVSQDFVNAAQNGSNVAVYSFDASINKVGFWQNITSNDKSEIVSQIGNMTATGQRTALWDAVCSGVQEMEEMGKTGGQHIQLLISYTDGKDNSSTNLPSTCLEKYQSLQKNGYAYWIYNAIGGATVPIEINDLKDIIGIVNSTIPPPIRVVQVLPVKLNLGNLFSSGSANAKNTCLVFWASDPSIYGSEIQFNSPPQASRNLPTGSAAQVCSEGSNCNRSIKILTSPSCLQFSLVNYDSTQISPSDTGNYSISLKLEIPYSNPQDQIFVIPPSINLVFQLEYPPTSTSLPTATATATLTPAPTLTMTPIPTITPTPIPTTSPATVLLRKRLAWGGIGFFAILIFIFILLNIIRRNQPPRVTGSMNYWLEGHLENFTNIDLTEIGKKKNEIRVGSSPDNDIVIGNEDFQPRQFTLLAEKSEGQNKLILKPDAPIKQGYFDLSTPFEVEFEKEYRIGQTTIKFFADPNL